VGVGREVGCTHVRKSGFSERSHPDR
jgi:hypothetical protein